MSSASTGRYQSRFLNLLLEKSQQLSDRVGQAARQVKTTTIWTVQLLMYPLYAMFQTGRLVGKQLQQTVSQKRPGLPGSKPRSSSVAKVQSPPKQLPTKQPETAIAIAVRSAIATVSESEADLPLPPLTDKPNDPPLNRLFHKLINWMETGTVAVKVNLFKESKLIENHLPPNAATGKNISAENIGTGARLEADQANQTEDSSFLKSIDRSVAQLEAGLEAGQFPQWQEMTDAVVDNTRSLWEPVKNWYMWQGDYPLNLEDDDLTRDLWAEPNSPTPSSLLGGKPATATQTPQRAQTSAPQLLQVVQKSEAVIRSTITEWFGKVNALVHIPSVTSPNQGSGGAEERGPMGAQEVGAIPSWLPRCEGAGEPGSESLILSFLHPLIPSSDGGSLCTSTPPHLCTSAPLHSETTSTLTQTQTPVTGMGEPETGRDYIETKVVSVGYVKHPLQVVLEAIDWVMLRLEKIFLVVRDWLLVTRDSLFSS